MIMDWREVISSRAFCQEADYQQEDGIRPPIDVLPILASDFFEDYVDNISSFGWTPKLRVLLAGVSDDHSPFQKLRGFEDSILRQIASYFAAEYVPHVKLTLPAKNTGKVNGAFCRFKNRGEVHSNDPGVFSEAEDLSGDFVSFASCGSTTFPPPKDLNVNMMPFILGDKYSLPIHLRPYYDCIEKCPINPTENGTVCYLTVHESYVQARTSQRRDGLHIETPGLTSSNFSPGCEHHWGGGHFFSPDVYDGGIYFASNVANSSIVYDALIDKNIPGIVDKHGSCEHLRNFIGSGTSLEAGQLVWMTDRTPHEALVQEREGYRQFFRVVTSKISHWYAQHNTPNPYVALPDNVIIIEENKFEENYFVV
jgi:hypothetical protein